MQKMFSCIGVLKDLLKDRIACRHGKGHIYLIDLSEVVNEFLIKEGELLDLEEAPGTIIRKELFPERLW